MSALLGVERIRVIPCDVMDVNLLGTINALRAAAANDVERFLLASSSEIYGEPHKLPITEDDDKSPISFYGVSKLAAEAYCQAYYQQRGLKTTCVRYFNVYGPGQTERFVVSIFMSKVSRGEPPIIYGHGNQSRCYTYVDDAVNGTILAASLGEGIGEVFNIGNDVEVSILQIAEYIIEISGKDGLKPVYRPFGDGIRVEAREIMKRKPDILKARTLLGFDPTVTWQEGFRRVLEWHVGRGLGD
jgi:UDP-glucose 4-epimerase